MYIENIRFLRLHTYMDIHNIIVVIIYIDETIDARGFRREIRKYSPNFFPFPRDHAVRHICAQYNITQSSQLLSLIIIIAANTQ